MTLLVLCGLPGGHFRRPDALVPDLVLDTTGLGPQAAAQRIVQLLPGLGPIYVAGVRRLPLRAAR